MIEYDVEEIASELMLTTSELREVLDTYFDEIAEQLLECYVFVDNQDYTALAEMMHGIKGASINLRMDIISDMAADLEHQGTLKIGEGMTLSLSNMQKEIDRVKEFIDDFYTKIL